MYDKKSKLCYHVATICSNIYVTIQIKKTPDSTYVEFGCQTKTLLGNTWLCQIKCILFYYMKFPSSRYILPQKLFNNNVSFLKKIV